MMNGAVRFSALHASAHGEHPHVAARCVATAVIQEAVRSVLVTVAAEFGQAEAAQLLLEHGADVSLLDLENDAIALSWAAFFGRPEVTRVLLEAGSDPQQRNKHGLTPLDCALGGTQGQWQRFSNASLEDWRRCVELLRS